MSLSNFTYYYQDNAAPTTAVLLHGTGGDEHDLLPLAQSLRRSMNLLSLRGNVVEHGMHRFFRRTGPGVFDESSIRKEAQSIEQFVNTFVEQNRLQLDDLVWIGYSNGANMIAAVVLLYPHLVRQAVLLHPMVPLQVAAVDLRNTRVGITYGQRDRMILLGQTRALIELLERCGAAVDTFSHEGGHEIATSEVRWIDSFLSDGLT